MARSPTRTVLNLTQDLARRAAMEELVARVSRSFVGLGPGDLDGAVTLALADIGEFVGADRSYVFLYDRPAGVMSNTHEWCSPGTAPQRDTLQRLSMDHFAWILGRVEHESVIEIPLVADLPPESAAEKAHFSMQGIQSLIMVTMRDSSGRVVGFIGFDAVRHRRPWQEEDRHLLMVTGDLVAAALQHQRLMRRLTESENRIRATLEALPDLLLVIDDRGFILESRVPAARDLSWPGPTTVGTDIRRLISRRDFHTVRAAVHALRTGAAVAEFTLTMDEPRGRRHFEGRLTRHGPGRFLALIREDTARKQAEAALKDLALQLTAAEEVQRRALSLQLHDGIGQELTALHLRLQAILEGAGAPDPGLARAVGMLQETMRKTQDLTFDLSPPALYELGLGAALGALVRRFKGQGRTEFLLDVSGPAPELQTESAVLLYRIAWELLVNADKHARASRVVVSLAAADDQAVLAVADDGVGMPGADTPPPESRRGGFGLFSIRQRLEPLGGSIVITSGPGTRVTVTLPCGRTAFEPGTGASG